MSSVAREELCLSLAIFAGARAPWRRHGEKQECDRRRRTRKQKKIPRRPLFSLCSFLLLHLFVTGKKNLKGIFAQGRGEVGVRKVLP